MNQLLRRVLYNLLVFLVDLLGEKYLKQSAVDEILELINRLKKQGNLKTLMVEGKALVMIENSINKGYVSRKNK